MIATMAIGPAPLDPPGVVVERRMPDPPSPILAYGGAWVVHAKGAPDAQLVNDCREQKPFVACAQSLDGKPVAMMVFEYKGISGVDLTYVSTALPAGGGEPRRSELAVGDTRWVYSSEHVENGKPVYDRVVNTWSARHIHYEIQTSTDRVAWTTTASGDEDRVPRP